MGSHKPTLVRLEHVEVGPDLQIRCKCNWYTTRCSTRQECEDQHEKHLAEVEKLRANMKRGGPSLTDQYAYYVEMSENPEVPENERLLWEQLARELAPRLPSDKTTGDQLSLDL